MSEIPNANVASPKEQNGLFTGRTIFDRWALKKLFLLPTALTLIFSGPVMFLGWAISQIDEAIAPALSDVPTPADWSRRELETLDGSGSGGKFSTFVVMSPDGEPDRADAESRYRDFVVDQGWERHVDFRVRYQRGDEGAEAILVLVGPQFRSQHLQ